MAREITDRTSLLVFVYSSVEMQILKLEAQTSSLPEFLKKKKLAGQYNQLNKFTHTHNIHTRI